MGEQTFNDGKTNVNSLKAALSRGINNLKNTGVGSVSMPPIEELTQDKPKTDTGASGDEWFNTPEPTPPETPTK